MFFKTSYGYPDYEISVITGRRKTTKATVTLKPAYTEKVRISDKKKKGILDLIEKKCVPYSYFNFYNSLSVGTTYFVILY